MVAGWQILSSGFLGAVQGQNAIKKNKGHHNILGVAPANKSLLNRAITFKRSSLNPGFDMLWIS